jgi:solute carrier family 36 (proton-coupled amino acid transporter)
MFCTLISWFGAADLDKFVSFIGSFAWYVPFCCKHVEGSLLIIYSVPLCYVYPAMLHYKACAHTRKQKIADIAMIVFGLAAAAYTTIQTLRVRVSFLVTSFFSLKSFIVDG